MIRPPRLRTLTTCVGIAAGVASTLTAFNFSEAARSAILRDIDRYSADLVTIESSSPGQPAGRSTSLPLQFADADRMVMDLPAVVDAACPIRQAWAPPPGLAGGPPLPVYACSSQTPALLSGHISSGRFFSCVEEDRMLRVCVVGVDLLEALRSAGAVRRGTIELNGLPYRIVGELSSGASLGASDLRHAVFVPWPVFARDVGAGQRADQILVRLRPTASPAEATGQLRRRISDLPGGRSVHVWHHQGVIEQRKRLVKLVEWLVGGMCLLTLLVACIGCANVMMVSVSERAPEIGLRLAVGATPMGILRMFLAEGFLLVIVSGLVGLAVGYVFTQEILKPLPQLVPDYRQWQFTFTGKALFKTMTILLASGFLGGFLPAWRACRMDPMAAIRSRGAC